jgi:hypothetical protein
MEMDRHPKSCQLMAFHCVQEGHIRQQRSRHRPERASDNLDVLAAATCVMKADAENTLPKHLTNRDDKSSALLLAPFDETKAHRHQMWGECMTHRR